MGCVYSCSFGTVESTSKPTPCHSCAHVIRAKLDEKKKIVHAHNEDKDIAHLSEEKTYRNRHSPNTSVLSCN